MPSIAKIAADILKDYGSAMGGLATAADLFPSDFFDELCSPNNSECPAGDRPRHLAAFERALLAERQKRLEAAQEAGLIKGFA